MQTELYEEIVKTVGRMSLLDENERYALREAFSEMDYHLYLGMDITMDINAVAGVLTYLERANRINQEQEEELWALLTKYEVKESEQNG